MQNQRLAAAASTASAMASPPALTSVRVRAASSQTDVTKGTSTSSTSVGVSCRQQGTQTETYERSPLPRVVDVSPKPTKPPLVLTTTATTAMAKSPNGGAAVVGSLVSWTTADEDERPSVERRSYSSRIPTPIKPLKTATTPVTSLLVSPPPPSQSTAKRELPDTPNRTQLIAKSSSHHHQGRYISSQNERKVQLQPQAVHPPSVVASRPSKSFWGAWWRL